MLAGMRLGLTVPGLRGVRCLWDPNTLGWKRNPSGPCFDMLDKAQERDPAAPGSFLKLEQLSSKRDAPNKRK